MLFIGEIGFGLAWKEALAVFLGYSKHIEPTRLLGFLPSCVGLDWIHNILLHPFTGHGCSGVDGIFDLFGRIFRHIAVGVEKLQQPYQLSCLGCRGP